MAKASEGWVGLYFPEDEGHPAALFRDTAHVTAVQHQHLGRMDGITASAEESGFGVNKDVRDLFASQATPAGGTVSEDAVLEGQIRTRLVQQACEQAIEARVREELGLPQPEGAPKLSKETQERLGVAPETARAEAKK